MKTKRLAETDWRICCKGFHVKTGTCVVAVVELVLIAVSVVYAIAMTVNKPEWPGVCGDINAAPEDEVDDDFCRRQKVAVNDYASMKFIYYAQLALNMIHVIIIVLLILSLFLVKPGLVVPHLIIQALTLAFLVIYAVFLGVHGLYYYIILIGILTILQCFFIYVIVRCYQYLKDQHGKKDLPPMPEARELKPMPSVSKDIEDNASDDRKTDGTQ